MPGLGRGVVGQHLGQPGEQFLPIHRPDAGQSVADLGPLEGSVVNEQQGLDRDSQFFGDQLDAAAFVLPGNLFRDKKLVQLRRRGNKVGDLWGGATRKGVDDAVIGQAPHRRQDVGARAGEHALWEFDGDVIPNRAVEIPDDTLDRLQGNGIRCAGDVSDWCVEPGLHGQMGRRKPELGIENAHRHIRGVDLAGDVRDVTGTRIGKAGVDEQPRRWRRVSTGTDCERTEIRISIAGDEVGVDRHPEPAADIAGRVDGDQAAVRVALQTLDKSTFVLGRVRHRLGAEGHLGDLDFVGDEGREVMRGGRSHAQCHA